MFITEVSTTCFGACGHLQIDELTKTHKQLYLACVFYTVEVGGFFCWMGVWDLISTTCFGAYGHLQVDELTKTHKQLYLACVFYTVEFLLLDGGTRSRTPI